MILGRRGQLSILLVLALTGCGGKTSTGPSDFDSIESLMDLQNVPGVSVAIIRDFQVDKTLTFGVRSQQSRKRVSKKTLFQAGAISKPVSAMAALRFVQDGSISLDEDINNHLTSWMIPANGFTSQTAVTLRILLSHTAGMTVSSFKGYRPTDAIPSLVQILNGTSPANSPPVVVDSKPGEAYRQSDGGYVVMQQALIDISGMPFDEVMSQTLLSPLGMTRSTFAQPLRSEFLSEASAGHLSGGDVIEGEHYVYPEMAAAGLWTTPTDLARVLIEVQKALAGAGGDVLSQASAGELLSAPVLSDFGSGFQSYGRGGAYFGHEGGTNAGFGSLILGHKGLGLGVVIMANSEDFEVIRDEVLRTIAIHEQWPNPPID